MRERGASLAMDSNSSSLSSPPPAAADVAAGAQNGVVLVQKEKDKEAAAAPASAYLSMVDPFLVEALQNPRHRLTSECFYISRNFL